ncbi:MAG: DUF547 domain-containing protein [Pseudomonadota bacterium]
MMTTTVSFSRGTDRPSRGKWLALAVLAIAAAVISPTASAQESAAVFAPFGTLLASSVDRGHVDYAAFANEPAFAAVIEELATTSLASSATQAERLAFYINAYNAVSIQGILDGYSPSSIWGRQRFFKRRKYDLFNTSMSLYTLEHKRIINEGDPRIHFAIVCASQSCPPLQSWLYTAEDLDEQLKNVTASFINNSASNQFDVEKRQAKVSRIFKWYADEFEAAGGGSLAGFLARYVADDTLKQSLQNDDWSFDYLSYDWNLNGTPVTQ